MLDLGKSFLGGRSSLAEGEDDGRTARQANLAVKWLQKALVLSEKIADKGVSDVSQLRVSERTLRTTSRTIDPADVCRKLS